MPTSTRKVKAIAAWPTPRSQKDLRKWLGLANYLHKYSAGYAELARPLSDLLKKDADWVWERQHQDAFDSIKVRLQQAPVLALPDESNPFIVVWDASDYTIGCALLQKDDEGHERVISFQSRQLKAAERSYLVHDKELLAMNKMVHLAPVRDKVTGKQAAQLFLDSVFRYHGLPETIVSDRDPRFTDVFWDTLFQLLGTKLTMSTADHQQTDGQTERVNRVLEDTLRRICAEAPRSWSDQLPMVEFALNHAVYASTGFTPFYLNGYVESNKLKHRFMDPSRSWPDMARLSRSAGTEEDQGENSPPQNEAESSGQPELPVSESMNDTQTGTHESHTKGMTVPSGKNLSKNYTHKPSEFLQGSSRSSAVNAPMELMSLTTKSVQILTKDLKSPRLASLRGSLITRSKSKGYLDRVNTISKLTDLVA
ncbi:DNA/RNA polymerase [Phytophthora palmivora]|uniref:DNA/RNA polymerase n=1 Tax=Phytophthora palmivora TaxID=4796 RepID=A0A2P4XKU0_9STRA|nr:DNA/RNA polymerase [Phytophthora palmivora]